MAAGLLFSDAVKDGKITAAEMKAIQAADKGKGQMSNVYLDMIKKIVAGDRETISALAGYGDYGAPGNNDNPYLKAMLADRGVKDYLKQYAPDMLGFIKGMDVSLNKGKTLDVASFKTPEQRLIGTGMYFGAGKTEGIDPAELAIFNKQAFTPGGEFTAYGKTLLDAGLDPAKFSALSPEEQRTIKKAMGDESVTSMEDYKKSLYYDLYGSSLVNKDNSLTEKGLQEFNNFWLRSGIGDRAQALDAFLQGVKPDYVPTSTGTNGQTDATKTPMPTDPLKLNEWAANNLIGSTVAPMSQQQIDALTRTQDIATQRMNGEDLNTGVRSFYNSLLNGTAPQIDPATIPKATANTINAAQMAAAPTYNPAMMDAYTIGDAPQYQASTINNAPQITGIPQVAANLAGLNVGNYNAPTVSTDFNVPMTDYNRFVTPDRIDVSQFSRPSVNAPAQADMIDTSPFANNAQNNRISTDFRGQMIDAGQFQNAPQITAAQMQAPSLSVSDNRYIGAYNPFTDAENPYLQGMVDKSGKDITRNYDNSIFNQTDALMARAGAFGGSAWQEAQKENRRQFANDLADATNQLRFADYNQRAQLTEADLARNAQLANALLLQDNQTRYQTGLANLNADMTARTSNQDATLAGRAQMLQALLGNQGANTAQNAQNLQALLANQSTALAGNRTLLDALTANQNTQLANAQMGLSAQTTNANLAQQFNGLMMQAQQANQALQQQQNELMLKAQQGDQQAALQLQQLRNNAAQANQSAQLATNQLNQQGLLQGVLYDLQAQQSNQNAYMDASQANQSAQMQAYLADQNALNQAGQYNINNWMTNAGLNQSALNNAAQLNQAAQNQAGQYNINNAMAVNQYNAGNQQAANIYNAGALNNASQFDVNNWMNITGANQDALLRYYGLQANAATQVPGLIDSRYLDANMLSNVGGAYRDYSQGLINESLNNWNTAQNWNTTQNNNFGNAVGMLSGFNTTSQTTTPQQYVPQYPMNYGAVLNNGIAGGLAGYGLAGGGGSNSGGYDSYLGNNSNTTYSSNMWNPTNTSFFSAYK